MTEKPKQFASDFILPEYHQEDVSIFLINAVVICYQRENSLSPTTGSAGSLLLVYLICIDPVEHIRLILISN